MKQEEEPWIDHLKQRVNEYEKPLPGNDWNHFQTEFFTPYLHKRRRMRLSQNRVEMASFVSSPIEVIWIFLKKGVYKLTFEGFILSNFFFRCHKPPKRLLLQDYVQWPAGRTQFQPS